jgi:hypothetical protein
MAFPRHSSDGLNCSAFIYIYMRGKYEMMQTKFHVIPISEMLMLSIYIGPERMSSFFVSVIQRSWFDSRGYRFFWEVVGLEWGQLSLMRIIEELFERKYS